MSVTRKEVVIVVVALLGAIAYGGVVGASRPQRVGGGALPVDPTAPSVIEARLALEQRRAGGPRHEIVETLLTVGVENANWRWASFAADACREGTADCTVLMRLSRKWFEKRPSKERAGAEGAVEDLAREAYLRSLSDEERGELYEKALREKWVELPGTLLGLGNGEAALRVVREGRRALETEARRSTKDEWNGRLREVGLAFRLIDMERGQGGRGALARCVEEGLEREAEQVGARVPEAQRGDQVDLAIRAVSVLRQRGDASALESLRRALVAATSDVAKPTDEWRLQRPLACRVAELIGDLGDRETELRLLGDDSLWNRVRNVEDALAKANLIQWKDRVAEGVDR